MARYRSKPVEVDAIVWSGTNDYDVEAFLDGSVFPTQATWHRWGSDNDGKVLEFFCDKAQSQPLIRPGDAIIREDDGVGFYPCVAAVFAERYTQLVDNEADGT